MSEIVVTAADLERMSPAERRAIFEASIITDVDEAPQHLIDRARTRVEQRIAELESQQG